VNGKPGRVLVNDWLHLVSFTIAKMHEAVIKAKIRKKLKKKENEPDDVTVKVNCFCFAPKRMEHFVGKGKRDAIMRVVSRNMDLVIGGGTRSV